MYMRMEVAAARVMKFEERRERLRPAGWRSWREAGRRR